VPVSRIAIPSFCISSGNLLVFSAFIINPRVAGPPPIISKSTTFVSCKDASSTFLAFSFFFEGCKMLDFRDLSEGFERLSTEIISSRVLGWSGALT
jgi:hypothetical protein